MISIRQGDIASKAPAAYGGRMDNALTRTILEVLVRAPQWVRQGLTARDMGVRGRAEETLAAMIASAIANENDASSRR